MRNRQARHVMKPLEGSRFALEVNKLVAKAALEAPVLLTRDHFDTGAMTHPHVVTERIADGSEAMADWPLLDSLLLCSPGADLVAVHAGGGGYSGYMQSAGVTIVADGTAEAAVRLSQGLDADTGLGVLRYADAGHRIACEAAARSGLRLAHTSDFGRAG